MKKLIVANWKLNPPTYAEAERLASGIVRGITKGPKTEIVVCPPFMYLDQVCGLLKAKSSKLKACLGAQDVFWEDKGAYTGEISPKMLKNSGVEYVIIGHSERRKWLHETDEMVNKKVLAAFRAGLKVILCIGEPLAVRRRGLAAAKNFIKNQLLKDLKSLNSKFYILNSLIVAYEPIWAISGGKVGHITDKPEDAAEMARFIKSFCASRFARPSQPKPLRRSRSLSDLPVIYGGSVTSKNIRDFIQHKEIDGALVGGASLNSKEFVKICEIASKI